MAHILIKTFKQISKADTLIAGGKGASLGEMTQAGIPVPKGFVILSNAFDRFLKETDLNVEIDAVLGKVDIKEVHTVENASKKIQAMILSKEMPEDIKKEILENYQKLNNKFVAVRSSATSEDSASAAWAGQLDSFLNTTKDTLLENVKKCWASLFTPRAIFYRFEKELNKEKISVAVIVQKMVESEKSGIAFSVHPVTQDKNQIIIEAGFGLGEAIVSGSITPDSYVIDKQEYKIIDINVNEQTKALYKKTNGGNEWKKLGEKGKKQVLSDKKIRELAEIVLHIESYYGFPCDVEWALAKGKFYILQSRPITTLTKAKKPPRQHKQYIKQVSRDMSLSATYYPFLAQVGAASIFGFKCKNNFWFSEKSFVRGYKTVEDDKQMKKQIMKFIKKGELVSILKEFRNIINQRIKLTARFVSADLNKKSRKWIVAEFKKFHNFYLKYWSYHLFAFNLDKTVKGTPYQALLEENEKLLKEVRRHNPFLFFDEKYLPHLFEYITKNSFVKKDILYYLTPAEIISLIESKNDIDWDEISKRQKYYFLCQSYNNREIIYSRNDAWREFAKRIPQHLEQVDKKEIKGDIAYKGQVTGRVKIILLKKDLRNIPPGAILVTTQTTPEFTPKLKKVKAIITDEGGVLCHAAIISRELKKPCIINTKIATKILKDGDLVEVDANKGMIRIIKK